MKSFSLNVSLDFRASNNLLPKIDANTSYFLLITFNDWISFTICLYASRLITNSSTGALNAKPTKLAWIAGTIAPDIVLISATNSSAVNASFNGVRSALSFSLSIPKFAKSTITSSNNWESANELSTEDNASPVTTVKKSALL